VWIWDTFVDWLDEQMLATAEIAFGLVTLALWAPQVYLLPQVEEIRGRALLIVNTGFVVAILAVGVVVMARGTIQQQYGPAELLPRLVIGFLAANFSDPILRVCIDLTNALRLALTGDGVTSEGSLEHITRLWFGDGSPLDSPYLRPDRSLVQIIIVVTAMVLVFQLVIGWFIRLAILIILAGIAPVALAAHATPWTDGAARLWWRTLFACLGTVLLQALSLHTGASVLLDPDTSLDAMGVPAGDTFDLLVFLVILIVTIKIPKLMERYVTGGGGGSRLIWMILGAVSHLASGSGRGAPGARAPRSPRPPKPPKGGDTPGSPDSPSGPRPNQPPKFSHRTRPHQPIPRRKDLKPVPEFSHKQPAHKPNTTPGKAEQEPVFSDFEPPYPADGSHPAWKPVDRPATLTPTPEFSHQQPGDTPVATPPQRLKPTPAFSDREAADAPMSKPPAGAQREPVFSHGGWRRGGQPAARQPRGGAPAGGTAQREGRPGGGDWPSVAVYSSRPGAARRPGTDTGQNAKPEATGSRSTTPQPVANPGTAARPVRSARPRPRPTSKET
jgi:hypothetical protein